MSDTVYVLHMSVTREGESEPEITVVKRLRTSEPLDQAMLAEAEKLCREIHAPQKRWVTA